MILEQIVFYWSGTHVACLPFLPLFLPSLNTVDLQYTLSFRCTAKRFSLFTYIVFFSRFFFPISVQFSCSVVSDSLWPHDLQHVKLLCPSPTPGACSNSCPSSWWCHPTISSSVIPFSSPLQSFPASGSFPISQFFASGGQRIGSSALASVLLVNIWDWFPLGLTGWISLQSKGLSRVFSNTTVSKASILWHSAFFIVQLSHPHMTTGKTITSTRSTFAGKIIGCNTRLSIVPSTIY